MTVQLFIGMGFINEGHLGWMVLATLLSALLDRARLSLTNSRYNSMIFLDLRRFAGRNVSALSFKDMNDVPHVCLLVDQK